jgi:hypothetical protein
MKKETKKYRVRHVVLCEVAAWRTIYADNMDEAMRKVAAIETITATLEGADYEIISDLETKSIIVEEV